MYKKIEIFMKKQQTLTWDIYYILNLVNYFILTNNLLIIYFLEM